MTHTTLLVENSFAIHKNQFVTSRLLMCMSGCILISVSSLSTMSEQQTNQLLVGEVEKHPILYNYHLPDYSKKSETEKAWIEVGNVVKLTAADCKERWKNIRTVFVRHMKPPKSGSGTKDKKAYYLADALQFTVPYIKALGKYSANLTQPKLEEEEGYSVGDGWGDDDLPSTSPQPPRRSSCSSTSTSALPQHCDHRSEPIKQHILRKKRAAKNIDVDKAFIEYLDSKKERPRKEALKMFLLSMLPDLMQMDDQEVRQFKRKALNVVDDILSTKSTRPPSSRQSTSHY